MAGSETLKELVAAAKEREGTVLDAAERSAPYSYREFATNCFKAGTLLGHYGVHPGAAVTVAVGPKEAPVDGGADAPCRGDDVMGYFDAADPLLAIFGGASVGAAVDVTPMEPVESRALVAPAWRSYETAPRCSTLAYGGPPDDPAVAHFEAELWSENPTAPPDCGARTRRHHPSPWRRPIRRCAPTGRATPTKRCSPPPRMSSMTRGSTTQVGWYCRPD